MDVEKIRKVASAATRVGRSRRTIHVIEDACEALGAEVHGRKAGSIAEAGLFAFYPNKQITTGEGGVLVTSNKRIAATAERLRNQGRDPARRRNQQIEAGFSYRLSDINCALGISQLARIESIVARRQMLAKAYDRTLAPIKEIVRPPLSNPLGRISWFAYPVRLAPEFTAKHRDQICAFMLKKGIGTGKYFAPLHKQPVLGNSANRRDRLPNTEAVASRMIALPFFNELTPGEIQCVAEALEESIGKLRRKM